MGSWFSSETTATTNELNGQFTNVIVEEGFSKIDSWHTILLMLILALYCRCQWHSTGCTSSL